MAYLAITYKNRNQISCFMMYKVFSNWFHSKNMIVFLYSVIWYQMKHKITILIEKSFWNNYQKQWCKTIYLDSSYVNPIQISVPPRSKMSNFVKEKAKCVVAWHFKVNRRHLTKLLLSMPQIYRPIVAISHVENLQVHS